MIASGLLRSRVPMDVAMNIYILRNNRAEVPSAILHSLRARVLFRTAAAGQEVPGIGCPD